MTTRLPKPTDSELSILTVIWRRGPSTVREIVEEMGGEEQIGYTTVLKLLQIMTDKGLVVRDETERAHVYSSAATEQKTQRLLISDLLDRAFEGSAAKLVMQALSTKKASSEELEEIRRMLRELEGERR